MNETDSVLTEDDAPEPALFGYLENFELSQVVDPAHWAGYTLELRLRSSCEKDSPCRRLEFRQVQELRLGPLQGLSYYSVEIRPATQFYRENVHYHVIESDHNAFSFFCRSYSAATEGI